MSHLTSEAQEKMMSEYFLLKQRQIQMVRKRGYTIPQYELDLVELGEKYFKTDYVPYFRSLNFSVRNSLFGSYFHPDGRRLLVWYADASGKSGNVDENSVTFFASALKTGISVVQQLTGITSSNDPKYQAYTNGIIITPTDSFTSKARSILDAIVSSKIQRFSDIELFSFDPDHVDHPEYVLLSKEETESKMAELGINRNGISSFRSDRILAKYYDWPINHLVRITRNDDNIDLATPISVVYRVVKQVISKD
jgi:DNA-directed RNA polymerase subunit H (RpoH/RPB5)